MQEQVAIDRKSSPDGASRGRLPHFTVRDYVLVVRVRKKGRHHICGITTMKKATYGDKYVVRMD